MKSLCLENLYDVCDRAEGAAPASPRVIADSRAGYTLQIEVSGEHYEITGNDGTRLHFRTIEHILDVLADAPDLQPLARLDFSRWQPCPEYG